jgi:oxygen-dependent protoporphyrinogen oxidase
MVQALAAELGPSLRTGAGATAASPGAVLTASGVESADAIVLACGADASSRLLGAGAPEELASIAVASTAVVALVYPQGTADALPDGTGFVVPRGRAPMTAVTFLSRKWPDDAFGDRAVLRCFVGGAGDDDVLAEDDDDIVDACARHLSAVMDLPAPAASRVHRWWRAMPQYELGHLDRVRRIRAALPPGIFVAGSAFDGIGVSDLARAGERTAAEVLAHLDHEDRG